MVSRTVPRGFGHMPTNKVKHPVILVLKTFTLWSIYGSSHREHSTVDTEDSTYTTGTVQYSTDTRHHYLNARFHPPGLLPSSPAPESHCRRESAEALARATSLPRTGRSGRGEVQEDAQPPSRAYGATRTMASPPFASVEIHTRRHQTQEHFGR